jgi:hypothetical protein
VSESSRLRDGTRYVSVFVVAVVVVDVFIWSGRSAAGAGIGRSTKDSESSGGSENRAHLTAGTGTVEAG